MDWLTFFSNVLKFVSDLIGSLAWPALILFLLWKFRTQLTPLIGEIKPLIDKMTSLKVGAVEAKFGRDAEKILGDITSAEGKNVTVDLTGVSGTAQVGNVAAHVGPPHVQLDLPIRQQQTDTEEVLYRSPDEDLPDGLELQGVDDDPTTMRNSAIVAMAWRDVEGSIDKLARALGTRISYNKINTNSKLRAIERVRALKPRFVQALYGMQKLRNEVIHTPEFEPTDDSTKTYLEGVREARQVLKEATIKAPTSGGTEWGDPPGPE